MCLLTKLNATQKAFDSNAFKPQPSLPDRKQRSIQRLALGWHLAFGYHRRAAPKNSGKTSTYQAA
jgi:hypothetical protein